MAVDSEGVGGMKQCCGRDVLHSRPDKIYVIRCAICSKAVGHNDGKTAMAMWELVAELPTQSKEVEG